MSPPEWRTVPGHPAYEVSEDGQVRRALPGQGARVGYVLRAYPDSEGYPRVHLNGKVRRVHVLVARAFLPLPLAVGGCAIVHHLDEVKANNHRGNLELCPSQLAHGERHRRRDGMRRHGEPNRLIRCACGCGGRLRKYDSNHRSRRFINGHNRAKRRGRGKLAA